MYHKLDIRSELSDINTAIDTINDEEFFKKTLNKPTGNFFYDSWEIKEEYKNTVWEKLLSQLPEDIGEARVIQLSHGKCYQSHADIDDRYHLTMQGQYSYIVNLDLDQMYKTNVDGNWYYLSGEPRHIAANYGYIERIQLVVRRLLYKNTLIDPINVEIKPGNIELDYVRFRFDNLISSWLNRANVQGHLTNFGKTTTGCSFDLEKSMLDELKSLTKDEFEIICK